LVQGMFKRKPVLCKDFSPTVQGFPEDFIKKFCTITVVSG
jgi:hypothetical protein